MKCMISAMRSPQAVHPWMRSPYAVSVHPWTVHVQEKLSPLVDQSRSELGR